MHTQSPPDCERHIHTEVTCANPMKRKPDDTLSRFVVVPPGQPQPQTAAERASQNKWTVLVLVAIGTFMTTLDASIVNISLPSIARAFHTRLDSAVEWVIIAYLVVIAATLLTFGRLSDIYGRKPIWLAGLVIFTLGSVLCGTASSLSLLI